MSSITRGLNDFKVLVSIDFGTTYSGCAYKSFANIDEPKLLDRWPDHQGHYVKTPTVNLYKKTGKRLDMVAWGFSSKLKMMDMEAKELSSKFLQLSQYKLHLDENASLPAWTANITVMQAISDFLKDFHNCAAEKIESQIAIGRENYRYCLTVPAMWSDEAKYVMRQAAINAGIISAGDDPDRLMLVSEPEAAALYCERTCKEYDLQQGDRFLICDAGGGTVDLIVYDVAVSEEGQTLSEVTKGHGASCGSIFIDENFATVLANRFANHDVKIPDSLLSELATAFAYQLKPNFKGDNDLRLQLPWNLFFSGLKNPARFDIHEGKMLFRASELREKVFDPVVSQVLELIRSQLDKARAQNRAKKMSAIFLVGGFASSAYLQSRVRSEFENMAKKIAAPNRPEMAVVYGAVYAGMNPRKVTARATRRCYGVGIIDAFDWSIDYLRPDLKFDLFGETLCRSRFSTFALSGQKIKMDECITHHYTLVNKIYGESSDYRFTVFAIDGDPPRYVTNLQGAAFISIPDPFSSFDPPGREISVQLSFYFGLSEIRVEATVQGKTFVTRLQFDQGTSGKLQKQLLFRSSREY
ncbi:hypothetical protein EMPS_04137 [Entomortierella parvispora]|uniref:Uncharacterized protein n=1 Tax=Entomortierella parvispora TaxID=205924 RepID=A0A9P3H852_9FUNG|nr:hypothetical protein EMPS_04137 [Entomortierella parvispora]